MSKFSVNDIKGVVPPIATPINKDETVDEPGMRRLVQFLLRNGANCIFVMGGTGEFFCLADNEKRRALEIVVDEVNGQAPVIAGITELSTRRTIGNAQIAQEAGADFVASLPPFFFSMDQAWITDFYTAIADVSALPLLLYNILNPIHTNILPTTAKMLSQHPNIVGIKDSEEFAHVQETVFLTRDSNFKVLCGLEGHFYAAVNVGASGGVLSASNFCPSLCREIYDYTSDGNNDAGIQAQGKLNNLLAEFQGFSSWWGIVKTSLNILGLCENTVTHPVPTCTDEERLRLKNILNRYDLIIE